MVFPIQRHVDNNSTNTSFYDQYILKVLDQNKRVLICERPPKNSSPSYKLSDKFKDRWKSWGCDFTIGIKGNLDNAYCVLAANGTTPIFSTLNGVSSYTFEYSVINILNNNCSLDEFLKNPPTPDRTKWLNWIAYQQWTPKEMKKGKPINYLMSIKDYAYY